MSWKGIHIPGKVKFSILKLVYGNNCILLKLMVFSPTHHCYSGQLQTVVADPWGRKSAAKPALIENTSLHWKSAKLSQMLVAAISRNIPPELSLQLLRREHSDICFFARFGFAHARDLKTEFAKVTSGEARPSLAGVWVGGPAGTERRLVMFKTVLSRL